MFGGEWGEHRGLRRGDDVVERQLAVGGCGVGVQLAHDDGGVQGRQSLAQLADDLGALVGAAPEPVAVHCQQHLGRDLAEALHDRAHP